jgi:regulatory protein
VSAAAAAAEPDRASRSSVSDAAVWDTATRFLAGRDRSAQEIQQHLAARGVSATRVKRILGRLRRYGYVDDRRYAQATAQRAASRGYGSERVRFELSAKGIDERLADAAVAAFYGGEQELARAALARRFGPDRPPTGAKAARFLHSRGFPEDIVLAIVEEGC